MRIRRIATLAIVCLMRTASAQDPIPDATLAQRLHQNSSLYQKWDNGESLRTKAAHTLQDVSQTTTETVNSYYDPDAPQDTPQNDRLVREASRQSDAVVIGKVTNILSELTPNEAFIFSDAQLSVQSIWYKSPDTKLATGNEVTITFPGGQVQIDGHKLTAQLRNDLVLKLNRTYLLFLKFIPSSQSYQLVGLRGFDVTNEQVSLLHSNPERETWPILADRETFLQTTLSNVTAARPGGSK